MRISVRFPFHQLSQSFNTHGHGYASLLRELKLTMLRLLGAAASLAEGGSQFLFKPLLNQL
jgi:hypothetical protein